MGELFGPTNGVPSMQEELLSAVAGGLTGVGTLVKENIDQTRKLVERTEGIREVNERMVTQEKRIEEVIRIETEAKAAIQQAVEKIEVHVEKVELLQGALQRHGQLFEKPLDKSVHYHHFIGKAVWVLAGMVVVTVCALTMTVWQWQRAAQYSRDEMKWRFMKLSNDTAVVMWVHDAERRSLDNTEQFGRDVQGEEDRRADLIRNLMREQETRRRIEELEKQKTMK